MLGQKEQGEAFIETRLDRFAAAGPPPPPPPPPAIGGPHPAIVPSDPLGSGLPPLSPPAPTFPPSLPPEEAPLSAPAKPAPVPAVEEELAPAPSPAPAPRPKARPSVSVRLMLADGTTSELDDPELAARANYLVKNLLSPKPPGPGSS